MTGFVPRKLRTHCKRGHEFTEENSRHFKRPEGGRTCKACELIRNRAKRKREKLAGVIGT